VGLYRTCVRPAMPAALRRKMQPLHRNYIFKRGLKRLLADPASCTDPACPAIKDFIYGWNSAWCARPEYIAGCIAHTLDSQGPILECGSGLTTVALGALAQHQGRDYWALEHAPQWADRLQSRLDAFGLHAVNVATAALVDRGEYAWYDAPTHAMPKNFAMVVCDGPPAATKGGRFGLLPEMRDRLADDATILLDDARRPQERAIAQRWADDLDATLTVHGQDKPYIAVTRAA